MQEINAAGSMQIEGMLGNRTEDWKMYLVQELCDASLVDALEAGILHGGEAEKKPRMVRNGVDSAWDSLL